VVFVSGDFLSQVEKHSADKKFPEGDPPLLMSLSSGTTGRPKGPRIVTASSRRATVCSGSISASTARTDSCAARRSTTAAGARSRWRCSIRAARRSCCHRPYEPEALVEAIEKHRISSVFLVPTLIRRLVTLPAKQLEPLQRLRLLLSSGSALHAEERRMLRALCRGFVEYYSSTEGGGVAYLSAEDDEKFSDSVGRPCSASMCNAWTRTTRRCHRAESGAFRYQGPACATASGTIPKPAGNPSATAGGIPATSACWTSTATCT
jgi:acyl-coenzyme A synthetase/AMP-(fatty) acid ligase